MLQPWHHHTSLRVLLIESSAPGVVRLAKLLERAEDPITTHATRSLAAALALPLEEFDACVLDLELPDSRGLGVLQKVKARAPDLALVVRTDDDATAAAALAEGAADVLPSGRADATIAGAIFAAAQRQRLANHYGRPPSDLEFFIEQSPEPLLVLSEAGLVEAANRAAGALLGHKPNDLVGRDAPLPTGPPSAAEQQIRRSDGTMLTVHATLNPLRWRQRPAQLLRLIDITAARAQRARAEHLGQLHEALNSVYHLLANEPNPAPLAGRVCELLTGPAVYHDAWIAYRNPHAPLATPTLAVSGTGSCVPSIRAALNDHRLPDCYRRALTGEGPVSLQPEETCAKCPLEQRSLGPASIVCSLRCQGEVYGVLGLAIDPGDSVDSAEIDLLSGLAKNLARAFHDHAEHHTRTRTEQALRRTESELRSIADGVPVMLAHVDADGRLQLANRALAEWAGETQSDLLGMPLDQLQRGEFGEVLRSHHEQALKGDSSAYCVRVGRPSGEYRQIEVQTIPRREASNDLPSGYFLVAQDITNTTQMQARVAQADRLASVGLLASGVAHEINNPLTYILHCAQRLEQTLPLMKASAEQIAGAMELPPALQLKAFDDALQDAGWVASGARRVRDVVKRLSTFARGDDEGIAAVDVNATIESALLLIEGELRYRAHVMLNLGPLPIVVSSPKQLNQVVLNLLINAAQAMEEGKVDENELRITSWQAGETVKVEISDTGAGIPEHHLPHIFDPFFTTKDTGSTGLGLSIANTLTTALGGNIEVRSELGDGTAFTVTIPIAKKAPGASPVPDKPSIAKPRVLIVDDEPVLTMILAKARDHQFEITRAHSGGEGKQLIDAAQVPFDAIVCDVMMPEGTGIEVYEHVRRKHRSLAPKIVFITGGAFTERTRSFLEAIDNPRLDKPFPPHALVPVLERLIGSLPQRVTGEHRALSRVPT